MCCLQLSIYLGKRDFVDHVESVDSVGEWGHARHGGGSTGSERPGRPVPVPVAACLCFLPEQEEKGQLRRSKRPVLLQIPLQKNGGVRDKVPLQNNPATLLVETLEEASLPPDRQLPSVAFPADEQII